MSGPEQNEQKKRPYRRSASGFTLVEIMVTAGLMALVFGSVFSVMAIVHQAFERESERLLSNFDVYAYFASLERRLGDATGVQLLRDNPGFRIVELDFGENRGREEIHLVRDSFLYIIRERFSWQENEAPFFEAGRIVFPSRKQEDRHTRKEPLKGIDSVDMRMVYSGVEKSHVFHSLEVTMHSSSNSNRSGKLWTKRFPAGGHQELDARNAYIFQDPLPDESMENRERAGERFAEEEVVEAEEAEEANR